MIPDGVTIDAQGIENCLRDNDSNVYLSTTDLFRVIKNTVINGAHAMNDEGTVTLSSDVVSFKIPNRRLELPVGDYARIQVSDTGKGIAPEVIERIFDPFFTTKDAEKGTGLGLSIVYNMVKNWKGGLDVESVVGEGTTFSFYIPLLSENAVKKDAAA